MPTVFVSYSHLDNKWCDRSYPYALIPWLENALRRDGVTLWYDRSDTMGIQPGAEFLREILSAIDAAEVALLLISEAFFASDFIRDIELPRILERAKDGGLVVIPVLLEPCDWQGFEYVSARQMLPGEPTPLIDFTDSDRRWAHARDQVLSGIRRRLRAQPAPVQAPVQAPVVPAPGARGRGSRRRLLYAGAGLIGLAILAGALWALTRERGAAPAKTRATAEATTALVRPVASATPSPGKDPGAEPVVLKETVTAPDDGAATELPTQPPGGDTAAGEITVSPAGLFDDMWAEEFDWSPDGSTVIIGGGYLYEYDVAAGVANRISTETMGQIEVWSDGSTLVAAPYDGLTLWDVPTWTKLKTLEGSQSVNEFALSPDDGTVVAGMNTALVFFDLAGDTEPRIISSDGYIQVLAYSPDGRTVASAGSELTLWDAAAGTVLRPVEGPQSVTAMAFSPDSTVLAAAENGGTVRLWNVETGLAELVLTGHTGAVKAVAFSPNGALIATGGADLSVRLWDAATGEQMASVMGHTSAVARVAFSPDGTMVASGAGDGLRLWRLAAAAETGSSAPSRPTPGPIPTPVPLSPSAISPGNAGSVTQSGLFETYADEFVWSPDGATVVIGGSYFHLYDVATDTGRRVSTDTVGRVCLTPDGATLIGAFYDGITAWDVASITRLSTLIDSKNPNAIALSPDGATLFTAIGEALKAWDLPSGAVLGTVPAEGYVGALAFSPDGRTLAVGGSSLTLWDVATLTPSRVIEGQPSTTALAFFPDGSVLAASAEDGTRLWDLAADRPLRLLSGHSGATKAVAISPNSLVVATGGTDGTVRLWDVATGEELAILAGHTSEVKRVVFSPDGALLASGGSDALRIWRVVP